MNFIRANQSGFIHIEQTPKAYIVKLRSPSSHAAVQTEILSRRDFELKVRDGQLVEARKIIAKGIE